MYKKTRLAVVVLGVFCVAVSLQAQTDPGPLSDEALELDAVVKCLDASEVGSERREVCNEKFDPEIGAGDLQGNALENDSGVVVEVDDKTQRASIRFTKPWLASKFSATVSATVDKDTGSAEFLGFGADLGVESLTLSYDYIKWPEIPLYKLVEKLELTDGGIEVLRELDRFKVAACVDVARELHGLQDPQWPQTLTEPEKKALADELKKHPLKDLPSRADINNYIDKERMRIGASGEKEKKVQSLLADLNDGTGLCKMIEGLLPADELHSFYWRIGLSQDDLKQKAVFWGGSATVGRKDFAYLDRDILVSDSEVKTTSDDKLPRSLGVSFGWLFLEKNLKAKPWASLTFSYSRQISFNAADNLTFCQPAEGLEEIGSLQACKEIAGAGPSETDSDLLSVEYRQKVRSDKIGLAIRGFYRGNDGKDDDFGFEVPIYFLTNKDGGFQGGLSLGWRDQDEDSGSLAVFVGRKFEL